MVKLVSISQAILVAEHLSFSRAAQVLGVRQSAVSRRVRELEDKLGVSLFERDASGVRLTEAGRRFLDRSRSALAEIDHAVKGAGQCRVRYGGCNPHRDPVVAIGRFRA